MYTEISYNGIRHNGIGCNGIEYMPFSLRSQQATFIASKLATAGSAIRNALRIVPVHNKVHRNKVQHATKKKVHSIR